ncbi:hypothetical protein CWI84_08040 [Idiomarina tyrosinivorans]|uniref:TVP38/TMEM64 family membrane protein n=1 Tax=Idiomarina tyrosinivorans TaxID=1445662 RepID=A0A432ZPX2_9GAMM|nr:VTT domain-containing protein [Idiomarina tyrosinivorans]RUO79901.1 hypothetical protein CWI84_08040 [Idiomarina tyrosinivorans]
MKIAAKRIIKVIVVAALLVILGIVVASGALSDFTNEQWVSDYLAKHGQLGYWIMLGALTLLLMVGVPRQLVAITLGFSLGAYWGTAATLLVSGLACALNYWLAHTVLKQFVERRFAWATQRFSLWLATRTFRKVLMIRLMPIGNNLLTNTVAGAAGTPFYRFWAGSVLGYLPQTIVFALVGGGIGFANGTQLIASSALFVIASLIGWQLYRSRSSAMETGITTDEQHR